MRSRFLVAFTLALALANGPARAARDRTPAASLPPEPPSPALMDGITERASVSSTGELGNGPSYVQSMGQLVSADGRFVVFNSLATNLFPGDNESRDVFFRDRQTGTTELMSVTLTGVSAGQSGQQAISASGKTVAFGSLRPDLVSNPVPPGLFQLYVRDLAAGRTELVSVDSQGTPGNGDSENPNLSADGRFVVFSSRATNLAPGSNGVRQIYVHDRVTGATELVSVDGNGLAGNGNSDRPVISDDGQVVAFDSRATNFLTHDRNGAYEDVFVRDRRTGTTELASVSPAGNQSGYSWLPSLSADGFSVAFESNASDSCNQQACVFVRDLRTDTTVHAGMNSAGEPAQGASGGPRLSADARFVAFYSNAANLDAADANGDYDVFVRDLRDGVTRRASVSNAGASGDARSYNPSLSADGRTVVFESWATTLADDTSECASPRTAACAQVFVRGPAPVAGRPIRDWGHDELFRAEADVDGDGLLDYCRFVGAEPDVYFSCQLRRADGLYGVDYGFSSVLGIDRGLPELGSSLTDVDDDGGADYCRSLSSADGPVRMCAFAGAAGFLGDQFLVDWSNECATGTHHCDPNATCTNTPTSYTCACNPGYEDIAWPEGWRCRRKCERIFVGNGQERCVAVRDDGGVDLYLAPDDDLAWGEFDAAAERKSGTYIQADERPNENYCGPTAGKNFLSWYGLDESYESLAADMKTNRWDSIPAFLTAGAICGFEPVCALILAGAISEAVIEAGTLPRDLAASLYARMPAGYEPCGSQEIGSLEEIRRSLASGNPVVFLESRGETNLHWAVITGLYVSGGETWLRIANSDDRSWSTFNPDWGLSQLGVPAAHDFVQRVMRDDLLGLGFLPFTEVHWCPTTPAPPPPALITKTLLVPANAEWVDTGIDVDSSRLIVSARGGWSNVGAPTLTANGIAGHHHPGTVLESGNLGALVARVGGSVFQVGASFDGRTPAGWGRLYLAMNDVPGTYADNQGILSVQVSFDIGMAIVTVPASDGWVDSHLRLPRGSLYTIEASGAWSNSGPPSLGPAGFVGYRYPGTVLGSGDLASLIGRVGGSTFQIGSGLTSEYTADGDLFLSINDVPRTFDDNEGAVEVRVFSGYRIR